MTPWLVNPAREKMSASARREFCHDWNSLGDGLFAYSWKLVRSFSAIWFRSQSSMNVLQWFAYSLIGLGLSF
jgi:hypothetical protein